MTREEIAEGVRACVASVVGKDVAMVGIGDRIIDDLGADSLDLLDLVFQLEQRFGLRIKTRDLERRSKDALGAVPLEVDGVYTPEALAELRRHMPEVAAEELSPGLRSADLPRRFRVATFVNLVERLLAEQAKGEVAS